MKNKNDGLNKPKNFRRITLPRSCNTCDHRLDPNYSQFTTCRRCIGMWREPNQNQVYVKDETAHLFVCSGWKSWKA